ncbi:maternal embryonic leucine zipper kinase [Rhipicephalus sanguineus]|uniref:non-specific serine/threonine protein kinase n=1 Tax=Rhipicephalus sanguineus TaxID=34632 RepID=A0A9D4SXZ3_RHISA|nr:maternal embryonic leucine zipper kinase [Rhipicephalus sanguineus]KAH7956183.1 hypothetical protein HPB52_006693 [Rhipicephalus sanguineus]
MEPFEDELNGQYTLLETIGSGAFAKVKLAVHVLTGEKVAIKIIGKCSLGMDLRRVNLEIAALKDFAHQNICRLYQVIETSYRIYLVLEYCPGGELFDYVVQRKRLDEDEARHFFRQIVSAVAYVHRRGYAHRDLKPENLLLDADCNVKLIDFGLCAKPRTGMAASLRTSCGSAEYAAPELLAGRKYAGSGADIWSMGVLLYVLLCGRLPFNADNMAVLIRIIQRGKYNCPDYLSDRCVNLLSRMMATSPDRRITMAQLVNHPWLVEGYGSPVSVESTCSGSLLDDEVVAEMAVACGRPKNSVTAEINRRKCDYVAATYQLLVEKKNRGETVRLLLPVHHPRTTTPSVSSLRRVVKRPTGRTFLRWSPLCNLMERCMEPLALVKDNVNGIRARLPLRKSKELREGHFDSPKDDKNASSQSDLPTPARKGHKGTQDVLVLLNVEGETLSVSTSIATESPQQPGANLRQGHRISPDCDKTVGSSSPRFGCSAKNVFSFIEKGICRTRLMLKSRQGSRSGSLQNGPRKVEVARNVSSVPATLTPDQILDCLRAALQRIGIVCKQEQHTLWGKVLDDRGKVQLTFELEIVEVPQPGLLGISRKRLNGNSWHYKRVCEEVLKISAALL